MMDKNKVIIACLAGLALICGAYLLARGFRYFSNGDPVVKVTGMAERHITSDLATTGVTISDHKPSLKEGYDALKVMRERVVAHLKQLGFQESELRISGIDSDKGNLEQGQAPRQRSKEDYYYDDSKNYYGYKMRQTISIESNNVDLVDKLAASMSDLLTQDLSVDVAPVSYYYTKLDDLKMELLREASVDAHQRATIIAEGGKATLGKLKASSMGVFQIVGRHSNEDYYWGGTFNTRDKEKTANITIKASYILE